jgi:N6-adenosine-specific RNA methylase IME4
MMSFMLIQLGTLKHILKKVLEGVLNSIILVCLLTIYAIFLIDTISKPNCVLFLWAIDPMLPQAFKVIESWGFIYKTVAFTWAKKNKKSEGFFTGLGYWTRANPEMCLLATRGKPKRISKSVRQLVVDSRREHSRKPDRIRDDIVELCGDVSRIELFARQRAKGWDSWGNEDITIIV